MNSKLESMVFDGIQSDGVHFSIGMVDGVAKIYTPFSMEPVIIREGESVELECSAVGRSSTPIRAEIWRNI